MYSDEPFYYLEVNAFYWNLKCLPNLQFQNTYNLYACNGGGYCTSIYETRNIFSEDSFKNIVLVKEANSTLLRDRLITSMRLVQRLFYNAVIPRLRNRKDS